MRSGKPLFRLLTEWSLRVHKDLSQFPGGDLVMKGLADLAKNALSNEALLVLVASPRLSNLGIEVPKRSDVPLPYEHALYSALEARNPKGAHNAYNALIQRIVSFANAYSLVGEA